VKITKTQTTSAYILWPLFMWFLHNHEKWKHWFIQNCFGTNQELYGEYYRLRRTNSPKKKLATWLIFGFVVDHTLHHENTHSRSHNEIYISQQQKKGISTHHNIGPKWSQMNRKINPVQAIINTDAYLAVQMIKSSRYLNRSITPAQPFIKRNLYQGCKWSSPH